MKSLILRYVQEECLTRFPHVCRPGGLGNLPTSAAQQPAGQAGRFASFGGQMPQVSVIPARHSTFLSFIEAIHLPSVALEMKFVGGIIRA